MLLLPLLFILTVISEALQRSIGGAVAAAVAVTGGGGDSALGIGGGAGAFGGVGGGGWSVGGGEFDLGLFLEAAEDVWATLFVAWSIWYMLRFFR